MKLYIRSERHDEARENAMIMLRNIRIFVYRFNDGTVSVIAEGGEAEVWIKQLHSSDDAEVYNNIKNSRPPLEDWQKKSVDEWKTSHPGEESEKNWNLSMDGLMKTENPDTSVYAKQLSEMAAGEPDPMKDLLYEMLAELSEEDQELYLLYFVEGYSQDEIGEMKGVSQNTISKKIRRIKAQLTQMCRKEI
ncbi:MAG: sigma-70 family RNA polymerase sigma factor [Bacteroidales bacterium]|nr:sigma-70 family RNA polymerase sigma factor [Lachnoclostridium sp.]MCM1383876.1 sigma-70 family RNA polymerase sigma factor [Lachnoclostridium sp.]MCM1464471.1 sigma-70 family RNA polymerase sigma factor [Bacteroidales bacterium]